MRSPDDLLGWAFWVVILISIAVVVLLVKGCCFQALNCQVMLGECERGLMDELDHQSTPLEHCVCLAALELEDGGCE